jgi:hypothetical protein
MMMINPLLAEAGHEWRALIRSRLLLWLGGLLLLVDGGFLALHAGQVLAEWQGRVAPGQAHFSIEAEGGPSEVYEAAKAMACVLALALAAHRVMQPLYMALAAAFALALADNALALHERWGGMVAPFLPLGPGAAVPVGELSFFAAAGLAILAALGTGFARSTARHRRLGLPFVGLLLALGGFAVAVDLLHAAVAGRRRAFDRFFGLVEDGGEMVVLSLSCALAITLLAMLRDGVGARRR